MKITKDMTLNLKKLRKRRIAEGIPAITCAELINVNQSSYYKKEVGDMKITLHEAKQLADFFETTIEELFFDYNSPKVKVSSDEAKENNQNLKIAH